MPELPQIAGLVHFLEKKLTGTVAVELEVASIAALKTYDPAPTAIAGLSVNSVRRHGKIIDIDIDGLHLVVHFSRAGWLRWVDPMPQKRLARRGSPVAVRLRLDAGDGPVIGIDITEAGTRKGLAVYLVTDPADVSAIAALGPDALDPELDLARLLQRRMQTKRLLRDQRIISGIGNAYSDEILWQARISPFAIAEQLSADQTVELHRAITSVLTEAVKSAVGREPHNLKDDKRDGLRVHGRTGEACQRCGTTIAEIVYADSSLQYCPTCQTGGTILKDRSTSRFLK